MGQTCAETLSTSAAFMLVTISSARTGHRIGLTLPGNVSPHTPQGQHARRHHRLIPGVTRKQRIRRFARKSVSGITGGCTTPKGRSRSELFHRARGRFDGAHADCSQYSATLCHWVGVKDVTDTDWTGTLGQKGVKVEQPARGVFVFFGQPPFVHMGVLVRPLRASILARHRVRGFARTGRVHAPRIARLFRGSGSRGSPVP